MASDANWNGAERRVDRTQRREAREVLEHQRVLRRAGRRLIERLQMSPLSELAPRARVRVRRVRAQTLALSELEMDAIDVGDAGVAIHRLEEHRHAIVGRHASAVRRIAIDVVREE